MKFPNCVLTIGKFEAIHLGHQALLEEVIQRSKLAKMDSLAVLFEPHPYTFLSDPNYKPIFTLSERYDLLLDFGIDLIWTFCFDSDFSAMKAPEFCRKLFSLNAREIVIGENFRFGNGREGTAQTLREEAAARGVKVHIVGNVGNGEIISTSQIRKMLSANELSEAAKLLGFPFFIMGEVKKGQQIGRVLGFPTLNLYPPEDKFLLENGVYKTQTIIDGFDGVKFAGITNIGLRPTLSNPTNTKLCVETHIPSLVSKPNELYGRQLKVEFLRFLRPERKFDTVEELQSQISRDVNMFNNQERNI